MKQDYKVGLVGAGYILESHAKAIKAIDGVTLYAVCDQVTSRAHAAAAEFGIPKVFGSVEDIAVSDCDSVHVLLPPALHIEAANRLVEAGKHVFIEKPMGLAAADCRSLAEQAAARDVRLGVNHNFLFSPGYQPIRDAVRARTVGLVDHLSVNWLYPLPLVQFGPYNNWILAKPENLVFELGPHIAAYVLDLVGPMKAVAGYAGSPIDLPGDQRVYRHWHLIGEAGRTSVSLNLSVTPGQTNRSLSLRTSSVLAQFDLERGIGWMERGQSPNPVFDNLLTTRTSGRAILREAGRNFRRHVMATLTKKPATNPFSESVFESIRTFYQSIAAGSVDPRHAGTFGAEVIALCEAMVDISGVERKPPAAGPLVAASAVQRPSSVLVVGGTGFIGRQLVRRLVERGLGVRVLTRNAASARLEFTGLDVDIVQGSHGDPVTLDKALEGIKAVYHLAKSDGKRWEDYVQRDVEPTRLLGQAALEHGVHRFIYTGTIDSYASAKASDIISGDTPLDPRIAIRNHYARSKATNEAMLMDMHRTRGLPLVILRPGIVIGADSPPAHLGVARFNSDAGLEYWGDGTNPIPLVLVDDVVDALVLALDVPGIEGRSFLLTDAPLMSARDYVAAIEERAGVKITARSRAIWKHFALDAAKEMAKHAIRHPNRRRSSVHDWACRSHRARYDSRLTQTTLGWKPAGSRQRLIEGINASVDRFMR